MEVKQHKAFHIIPVDGFRNYNVGNNLIQTERKLDDFKPKKRSVEEVFEQVRKDFFPTLPSRLTGLFMCYNKENVDFWAYSKFGRKRVSYHVLELSLTGKLHWFNAVYYNEIFNECSKIAIDKAAFLYWESDNKEDTLNAYEVEGLFLGNAKITDIEIKENN